MWRHLKLIGLFTRICIQDTAAYRVDFLVHAVMAVAHLCAELIGVWIVFSNTRSLAGWTAYEVLALLGVYRMMIGAITLFVAPNMRRIMQDIREGTLDFLLLTPLDAQFYASFRSVVAWRVTDIALGAGLAALACFKLGRTVPPSTVLTFVIMLAAGVAIIYSFWLVLATCAFWFTRVNNIEMVFWNVFEAGRYPVDIYGLRIRWGLTYIIPLAFLTTFPAGALLGKTEAGGVALAMAAAATALIVSGAIWRLGIRHYSGASA
jgi:ABC-2 type transport system permease protein